MDRSERDWEENVARLVRAGAGPEARLDPGLRDEAFRCVLSEFRLRLGTVPFPDRILGILVAVVCLMAAWLGMVSLGPGISTANALPFFLSSAVIAINLVLVPVAGIVIVTRRRRV